MQIKNTKQFSPKAFSFLPILFKGAYLDAQTIRYQQMQLTVALNTTFDGCKRRSFFSNCEEISEAADKIPGKYPNLF